MRTCAVCDKSIIRADICNKCFKKWCTPEYPEWVKALVQIESHVQRYVNDREITISSLGMDEKALEMILTDREFGVIKPHPDCD